MGTLKDSPVSAEDLDTSKQADILPLSNVIQGLVNNLNRIPPFIRKVEFRLCDSEDPTFRLQAAQLEELAYKEAGYGDRAEAEDMFEHQYRGAEEHGDIAYIGIYSPEGVLISFFCVFQNKGFLFDESHEAVDGEPELKKLPVFVISKLARHPQFRRFLYKAGAPHRLALVLCTLALARSSKNGVLIETQGQPDTQRMLREENLTRFFPEYRKLVDIPIDDSENAPHRFLLYFPPIKLGDIFNIAKELIKQRIHKPNSKPREQ